MYRLASLAGAALIGLGAFTTPARSQDSPPAHQAPAPHAAPKSDGGSAADATTAPREAEGNTRSERDDGAPAPGPGGCPLFNRKLKLIV